MTNNGILASMETRLRESMSTKEYANRLAVIRQQIEPYERRKPKKKTKNVAGEYQYTLLSDALRNVRKGSVDYLYNENQVIEFLRYEPNALVEYKPQWKAWEVWITAA